MKEKADIFAALAHNEELVGALYRKYAERFPELSEFWNGLAVAEQKHSGWLNRLGEDIGDQGVSVTGRFSSAAITTFHNYLEREITAAGLKGYRLEQALATALYTEKSLIEKDFYQSITQQDGEASALLEALVTESREHLDLIRKKMKEKGLKAI